PDGPRTHGGGGRDRGRGKRTDEDRRRRRRRGAPVDRHGHAVNPRGGSGSRKDLRVLLGGGESARSCPVVASRRPRRGQLKGAAGADRSVVGGRGDGRLRASAGGEPERPDSRVPVEGSGGCLVLVRVPEGAVVHGIDADAAVIAPAVE